MVNALRIRRPRLRRRRVRAGPRWPRSRRPRASASTGTKPVGGRAVADDVHQRAAGHQPRRDDRQLRLHGVQIAAGNRLLPDAALEPRRQRLRLAGQQHASLVDDRHVRAQVAHVGDDVRGQDDDDVLADVREQVVEAHALLGVEAGGRLVDDDELRVAEQRLRDAEALAHAAGEAAQRLLAHVVQVGLLQQRRDDVAPRRLVVEALQAREVVEQFLGRDFRIHAEILRQVAQHPAHGVLVAQHVDVAQARACRRRRPAAWPACASASTCPRRWARAGRTCPAGSSARRRPAPARRSGRSWTSPEISRAAVMVDPVTAKGADYGDGHRGRQPSKARTAAGADETRMSNGRRDRRRSRLAAIRGFRRRRATQSRPARTSTASATHECVAPADERRFTLAPGDVDLEDALREPRQFGDDASSHGRWPT